MTNRQSDGTGTDTVTETGTGAYRKTGGKCYLSYETDAAKVYIKAQNDSVTVKRTGESDSEIQYVPGRSAELEYKTPYGTFGMRVKTDAVTVDAHSSVIRLRYRLSGGEDEMVNNVEIKWEVIK